MRLHLITGLEGTGKSTLVARLATRAATGAAVGVLRVGPGTPSPAGDPAIAVAELPAPAELAGAPAGPLDASCRSRLADTIVFGLDELARGLGGGAAAAGADEPRVFLEVPARLDPEFVVGSIEASESLSSLVRCDTSFALVDARADAPASAWRARLLAAQLRAADLVLLNHCDLADVARIDLAEAALRARNPRVALQRTSFADVELDDLGTFTYAPSAGLLREAALLALLERLPAGVVRAEGECRTERGGFSVRARPSRLSLEPSPAEHTSLTFVGVALDAQHLFAALSACSLGDIA